MSHADVQKRPFFSLTLPGTHHSGAYSMQEEGGPASGETPFGVLTQNLDVAQQLELGIRAFDMKIAWHTARNELFVSHGRPLVSLKRVLQDITNFLQRYQSEVIVLSLSKDLRATDKRSLGPLLNEDTDKLRVPGQRVHEEVNSELDKFLATYRVLSTLPSKDNPLVSSLVVGGARVVYFWEGQQVLCVTLEECRRTPGWQLSTRFAFGPPTSRKQLNKLAGVNGSNGSLVPPICLLTLEDQERHSAPIDAVEAVKRYASMLQRNYSRLHRPSCMAQDEEIASIHSPPLFYVADGVVTPLHAAEQAQLLRNAKAVFSRGEGLSHRSEAERMNYLLLLRLLKEGYRSVFTQPNVISVDFASPVIVHRIVESMQNRPECGIAVHCKATGSCWAASLVPPAGDQCLDEGRVLDGLETQAAGGRRHVFILLLILAAFLGLVFWTLALLKAHRSFAAKKELPGSQSTASPGQGAAAADAPPAAGEPPPQDQPEATSVQAAANAEQ